MLGQAYSGKEMLCSYLIFCFQREAISSSTKAWTIQFLLSVSAWPLTCVLGTPWSWAHSLAPGCHRGRHTDNYASWRQQRPFSTSALLFTDEKSLTGISPEPGRTCTKPDTNTDRGKSFLITEPGVFPCDLLLSKKAGKSLLKGKY